MQVLAHHPVVHLKITGMALILIIQALRPVAVSSAAEGKHLGDTEIIHHLMLEVELVLVLMEEVLMRPNLRMDLLKPMV